ncbi:SIS domain-containing protein [Neorhodopirellula lusitana]|uniref:SIS domain-containing protein n=1 Tax=Neorhodopirellula lusitana TaxID=445327 RepID=UPI0038515C02
MTIELSPSFHDYLHSGVTLRQAIPTALHEVIEASARAVTRSIASGGRVFFFGNGGSAADSQHLAAELSGRFKTERRPLPGLALTTDTSALTAIGNDYGYQAVFERQLRAFAGPRDVAIGISTSGNSPNVVSALEVAREMGLRTIAWTAQGGGRCAEIAEFAVRVPSTLTELVQEIHIAIGHYLCHRVDAVFTDSNVPIPMLGSQQSKAVSMAQLLPIRDYWRAADVRVVWTNGCFDLLHAGHLRSLKFARNAGDVLIVGLNTDASVSQIKGPTRPVIDQTSRMEMLAALEFVDYVMLMNDLDPCATLEKLRPDMHCKGEDYRNVPDSKIPEKVIVERHGGRLIYAPLEAGISTSSIVQRLKSGLGSGV